MSRSRTGRVDSGASLARSELRSRNSIRRSRNTMATRSPTDLMYHDPGDTPGSAESNETPSMNVDLEYRARIDAMSVAERVRRAEALFNWSREFLARSILATRGSMPDEQLKWEVVLRQYGAYPEVRELIDELRTRASR